ncbi:MAG: YrhB domain-containing protein [Lysobacteraceae bacterium]
MTASGTSDEEPLPILKHDHLAELPSAATGARWGRPFHSLGFKKMITSERAREICYREINRPDPYWPDKPEMVVTEVEELEAAWVIYYKSSAFLKSRNVSDALAGNGPYVVSKSTGRFAAAGTAPPLKVRIQEALRAVEA